MWILKSWQCRIYRCNIWNIIYFTVSGFELLAQLVIWWLMGQTELYIFFRSAKCHSLKNLRKHCPYQKPLKIHDSEQFHKKWPLLKNVVNVTFKSPKGLFKVRSHGSAVTFWRQSYSKTLCSKTKLEYISSALFGCCCFLSDDLI